MKIDKTESATYFGGKPLVRFSAETNRDVVMLGEGVSPLSRNWLRIVLNPNFTEEPDKKLDPPVDFMIPEHHIPKVRDRLNGAADKIERIIKIADQLEVPAQSDLSEGPLYSIKDLAKIRHIVFGIDEVIPPKQITPGL